MAHRDINIQFEVDDRTYEAVGFLDNGEPSVNGDTMLKRTADENGGAIGDDDELFLSERRAKFPAELRKYYLATARRGLGGSRNVSYFCWDDNCGLWGQYWHDLGDEWNDEDLVLRRCA